MDAVEGADHHRGLGKASSTGCTRSRDQFAALIVVAEGDDLGGLGAGDPQQVDPEPVAIIDLGPELAPTARSAPASCR